MAGLNSLDPKFEVVVADPGSRHLQGLYERRELGRLPGAVDLLVARTQEVARLQQQAFASTHESNMEFIKKLATMNELLGSYVLEMRQRHALIDEAVDDSRRVREQTAEQINAWKAQRRALRADLMQRKALFELESKLEQLEMKTHTIKATLAQQKIAEEAQSCRTTREEQAQLTSKKEEANLQGLPAGLTTVRPIHQLLLNLISTILASALLYALAAPSTAYRQFRHIHS